MLCSACPPGRAKIFGVQSLDATPFSLPRFGDLQQWRSRKRTALTGSPKGSEWEFCESNLDGGDDVGARGQAATTSFTKRFCREREWPHQTNIRRTFGDSRLRSRHP